MAEVSPKTAYRLQRNSAKYRGIAWEFSFESWWAVWQSSGKWAQRGVRTGQYVMARLGDVGPYSPGNVEIVTSEENQRQRHANKKHPGNPPSEKSQGWYRKKGLILRPYMARFRGRHLGCYETADEAHAAFVEAVRADKAGLPITIRVRGKPYAPAMDVRHA